MRDEARGINHDGTASKGVGRRGAAKKCGLLRFLLLRRLHCSINKRFCARGQAVAQRQGEGCMKGQKEWREGPREEFKGEGIQAERKDLN